MRNNLVYSFSAVIALFTLYILCLNYLPDDELQPGAVSWLESDPPSIPKEQNSHYLLWGLNAPAGVSMRDYGEAKVASLVAAQSAAIQQAPASDASVIPEKDKNTVEIEASGMSGFCELSEGYCLETYRKELDNVLELGDNALLLERYRQLTRLEHYQSVEKQFLDTPFMRFSPLLNAQRLHLATIGVRYLQGEHAEALGQLSADLRFSRMLMTEADILITKLVALKMTANGLQLYGQLLDTGKNEKLSGEIAAIQPLTQAERDFSRVIRGEFRFSKNVMQKTAQDAMSSSSNGDSGTDFVNRFLPFRINHMLNLQYDYLSRVVELSQFSPTEYEDGARELSNEYPLEMNFLDYLYDPVTAILYETVWMDFTDYLESQYALDGLIRLVKVKADIIRASVNADEFETFIHSAENASHEITWTGQVSWDPDAHMLRTEVKKGDRMNSLHQLPVKAGNG